MHASIRACKQIPEGWVCTNSKETFIMHVNSHEGDKESAAGHRQLDPQHTTVLSKITSSESVWASAVTTPQNNNLPQTHFHQQIHHISLRIFRLIYVRLLAGGCWPCIDNKVSWTITAWIHFYHTVVEFQLPHNDCFSGSSKYLVTRKNTFDMCRYLLCCNISHLLWRQRCDNMFSTRFGAKLGNLLWQKVCRTNGNARQLLVLHQFSLDL